MKTNEKFVEFNEYCPKCKYSNLEGPAEPCNQCLTEPVNEDSHQPVFFKEKEEK